jgi:prepilin-type N-terminal cleavage/methylation domain-containing protein
MSRLRRHLAVRLNSDQGFTLAEILVVILIISVLAAIAIPSFTSQRGKADDASAKSDARTAQDAMETYFGDHNDYNATPADLKAVEPTLNSANALTASGNATSFTVSSKSRGGVGVVYTISRDANGNVTRPCTPAGKDACPVSGNW